ncbi:STAS domain-containing protein [Candidatus Dependentiae bacterium]|nr:STAS domain-containing protein [Candidatus Dependentiae bacterium]
MENKILVTCKDGIAKAELTGRLDATSAPTLQNALKEILGEKIEHLVLLVKDLEYISSAGLRVIIFTKQKIGVDAKLYLIQPQDTVLEIIKMSGLDNFMIIQDSFEE